MQLSPMIIRHEGLVKAMKFREKTPEDLSKETGLDRQEIGSMTEADIAISPLALGRIIIALGVSPSELTDDPRMQLR